MEQDAPTRKSLEKAKFAVTRKHNLGRIPSNSELIKLLTPEERVKLIPVLRRKATRALSGVNVVAVMTKPLACPHGRCAFCPGGPDDESPQSYTGHEPAAMRGAQNNFKPYEQVRSRVEQLEAIGHTVDKIDLIVMGGTFPASEPEYQRDFIKGCLDAITLQPSTTLEEAKLNTEHSKTRNVGITFETRPDHLEPTHIDSMLDLGCLQEDLPYGTVLIAELGKALGVPTPVSRGVTDLFKTMLDVDYWQEDKLGNPSANLKTLGLDGLTKIEILKYVTTGESPQKKDD